MPPIGIPPIPDRVDAAAGAERSAGAAPCCCPGAATGPGVATGLGDGPGSAIAGVFPATGSDTAGPRAGAGGAGARCGGVGCGGAGGGLSTLPGGLGPIFGAENAGTV